MRGTLVICATLLAHPAAADCEANADLVMGVVTARVDGTSERAARRELRRSLGRQAADPLVEWVYGLPDEHLTEEIRTAWVQLCEATPVEAPAEDAPSE